MAAKTVPLGNHVFDELEHAMNNEALEWLQSKAPDLAAAVETATKAGASPNDIYLKVLHTLGDHRQPLAKRCQLAAQALRAG